MITFLIFLPFLLVYTLFVVWAERKIAGFVQDRYGPMETGYKGTLQAVADLLKMLQKENIVHENAYRGAFQIAPILIFVAIFAGFAVIPLSPHLNGADLEAGIVFLLGIISLDVMGILLAGWGSNSKFSMYGALRSVAQLVSYEVPLGISVLCVLVAMHTLNIQDIAWVQSRWYEGEQFLLGIPYLDISHIGGFLSWNFFTHPHLIPAFVIFFIASLAEANRAPFDLPEAEAELVGGYHTEYSGFRWGLFMLGEYAMMLLVSFLAVYLFFGGWSSPLPDIGSVKLNDWTSGSLASWTADAWGIFWLIGKVFVLVFLQVLARWTYPRVRVDQLMAICWKYLTPIGIVLLIGSIGYEFWIAGL